MKPSDSSTSPEQREAPVERWGSWEDAEHWRREGFLRRTPAQRLQWLEEMLSLKYLRDAKNGVGSFPPLTSAARNGPE